MASYHWNDESQLERFIGEGIWENGNTARMTKAVNSARWGDVLFAKTTWGKGEAEGILTIRAVGVVVKNHRNGRTLEVNWHRLKGQVDIYEGTHYRYAFQLIRDKYLRGILSGMEKQIPELHQVIEDLSQSPKDQSRFHNTLSQAMIDNDGAYGSEDLLNIENDVRSFALLLAAREVRPPLAIALFGQWGSGKSFFMRQLASRVSQLSENQQFSDQAAESNMFCKGIAQIEFNAWSYLDANLWAGLVSSIFEKLDEYISQRSKGDSEKLLIRQKLSQKLQVLASEKRLVEEKQSDLIEKEAGLRQRLQTLRAEEGQMIDAVAEKKLADLIGQVRDKVTLEQRVVEELEAYGISRSRVASLNPNVLKEEVMSWVTFVRNVGQFSPAYIGWFTLSFLLIAWIAINPNGWFSAYLDLVGRYVTIWVGVLVPLASKWVGSFNRFKHLLKPVIDFKNEYNRELEEVKFAHQKEVELIETTILQKKEEISRVESELVRVNGKIRDIEYTLDHFVAQRAFNNFIRNKVDSKGYDAHLGLISIIRRDFEILSSLFSEMEDGTLSVEEHDAFRKLFKEERMLDRIVLYIDDLDRCPDDKVLEVVQAVHLLMAFPLFNVVVGVDQRCVRNALLLKTKLEYRKIARIEEIEAMGVELIQPEEYLEKIFQIPFVLREPEQEDLERLVEGVLHDSVKVSDPKNAPWPVREESDGKDVEIIENEPVDDMEEPTEVLTKPLVSSSIDALELFREEVQLLKSLAPIVGNTPRTIKRYLNIYRIIRSHTLLKYDKDSEQEVFLLLMLLLALGVGRYKKYAELLFQYLPDHLEQTVQQALEHAMPEVTEELMRRLDEASEVHRVLSLKASILDAEIIQFIGRFSFGSKLLVNPE